MAFTKKGLADIARYRLRGGTDIRQFGIEPYQMYKWESDAVERLFYRDTKLNEFVETELTEAQRILANLYVKPFVDVPIVDGIADLTTLAETSRVVLQGIPLYGSVNHIDVSEPFIYLPSEIDLRRPKTSVWAFYSLRGAFLLTRNTDGLMNSLQGMLDIFAPQIPLITEVPRSRHEQLTNIMVEFFAESMDTAKAEKEAEK